MDIAAKAISPHAAKLRRIDLRVVLGLVLMVFSVWAVTSLVRKAQAREPVLVAAKAVETGAVIQEGDLRVEDVSFAGSVAHMPAARRSEVIGKVAAEPLSPGKVLAPTSVASSAGLPAGYVAMSTALKDDHAAAGELRPGDRVAVISSTSPDRPNARTTILLTGVPVIASRRDETSDGRGRIVTLRLRLEEARALAEARAAGSIDLVLLSAATR